MASNESRRGWTARWNGRKGIVELWSDWASRVQRWEKQRCSLQRWTNWLCRKSLLIFWYYWTLIEATICNFEPKKIAELLIRYFVVMANYSGCTICPNIGITWSLSNYKASNGVQWYKDYNFHEYFRQEDAQKSLGYCITMKRINLITEDTQSNEIQLFIVAVSGGMLD